MLGELERARTNMLTNWQIRYKERDKISHDRHARNMQEHFLTQEPLSSIDFAYDHVKRVLPTITTEEVFDRAKRWMGDENRVLIITGSDDPNTQHLTQKEAFDILDNVQLASIDPYEDAVSGESLISSAPSGSSIVAEKQILGW